MNNPIYNEQNYKGFTFVSETENRRFHLKLGSSQWIYEDWNKRASNEDEAIALLKKSIDGYLELETPFTILMFSVIGHLLKD